MIAKRLVLAALLSLATAASASAQGNPTGTISGRVLSDAGRCPASPSRRPRPTCRASRTAVTTENGDYILPLLPPGTYALSFELQGFRTLQQTTKVAVGQAVPVNMALVVAAASKRSPSPGRSSASRRPRR